MAEYRWDSPHEWLRDKLNKLANDDEINEILSIAQQLSAHLDADVLQDLFQREMDDEGYFTATDAKTCSDCGGNFDSSQMADPEIHTTIDREQLTCLDCHHEWLKFDQVHCKICQPPANDKNVLQVSGE
jgi:nitrate/TMAO reductase-like tetraheme cytochrome c subunit